MSATKRISVSNRLLASLPRKDRQKLLAGCEEVDLVFGDVLYEPAARISYIYFPTDGYISLVTKVDETGSLEVRLVGNEGMLGVSVVLGVNVSALYALVQGAGNALRMNAVVFYQDLANSAALRRLMNRYIYVLMEQLAITAACMGAHVVEARLARWLLMTRDRAHSDSFHITHDYMANLLGVRRVGVTKAAGSLQRQKLIHYRRGDITILDIHGLEAAACECYLNAKNGYDRILG